MDDSRPDNRVRPSKAAREVGATGPRPAVPSAGSSDSHVAQAGRADTGSANTGTANSGSPSTPKKRKIKTAVILNNAPAHDASPMNADSSPGMWSVLRERLAGEYAVDDFGFDPEFTDKVLLQAVRPLYRNWFRVEVSGIQSIPDQGGALVVANHSGTIAVDSVMTQVAIHDEHPSHRFLRMLGADLVFQTPFLGDVARRAGHTLACHDDAERLLTSGEVVGVWPEGFKGIGKPFSERYRLQRFGRGGFVSAAVRTGTPIIPTAIVGAEEIYPMVANASVVARVLGLPYFPITPTFPFLGPLGLVPLPSKWLIHFDDPIPTDHLPSGAADDPAVLFEITDQVRERIQRRLYDLLAQRGGAFA